MDIITKAMAVNEAKSYTDSQISTVAKGLDYKGSCLYTDLPVAAAANKGYMYTVTDRDNHEFVSDGSAWIDLNSELSGYYTKSEIDTALAAKSSVSVSATGTATDEIQYITVNGVEKKIAGGEFEPPTPQAGDEGKVLKLNSNLEWALAQDEIGLEDDKLFSFRVDDNGNLILSATTEVLENYNFTINANGELVISYTETEE